MYGFTQERQLDIFGAVPWHVTEHIITCTCIAVACMQTCVTRCRVRTTARACTRPARRRPGCVTVSPASAARSVKQVDGFFFLPPTLCPILFVLVLCKKGNNSSNIGSRDCVADGGPVIASNTLISTGSYDPGSWSQYSTCPTGTYFGGFRVKVSLIAACGKTMGIAR